MTRKKVTILALQDKKMRGEPITMITAYDYPGALAADRAGLAHYSAQRHGHRLRESLRRYVRGQRVACGRPAGLCFAARECMIRSSAWFLGVMA
jgi:hypothetical protein